MYIRPSSTYPSICKMLSELDDFSFYSFLESSIFIGRLGYKWVNFSGLVIKSITVGNLVFFGAEVPWYSMKTVVPSPESEGGVGSSYFVIAVVPIP